MFSIVMSVPRPPYDHRAEYRKLSPNELHNDWVIEGAWLQDGNTYLLVRSIQSVVFELHGRRERAKTCSCSRLRDCCWSRQPDPTTLTLVGFAGQG